VVKQQVRSFFVRGMPAGESHRCRSLSLGREVIARTNEGLDRKGAHVGSTFDRALTSTGYGDG
jgi:hypothetical protein